MFTDYARGPFGWRRIMDLPVFGLWTHDSIGLGEDGPTHQPIEQMVSLRAIPGMVVLRPADANEMTEAYRTALAFEAPAGGDDLHASAAAHFRPHEVRPRPAARPRGAMCWPMRRRASRR